MISFLLTTILLLLVIVPSSYCRHINVHVKVETSDDDFEPQFSLDVLKEHFRNASSLSALASNSNPPVWEMILSGAIDCVPLVGTAKSAIELITGDDLITGQSVPRWSSALGVVLSALPVGEAAEEVGMKAMQFLGNKAGEEGIPAALKALNVHFPALAKELPSMLKAAGKNAWFNYINEWSRPTAAMIRRVKEVATTGFCLSVGFQTLQVVANEEACRILDDKHMQQCLQTTQYKKTQIKDAWNGFVDEAEEAFSDVTNWLEGEFDSAENTIEGWFE